MAKIIINKENLRFAQSKPSTTMSSSARGTTVLDGAPKMFLEKKLQPQGQQINENVIILDLGVFMGLSPLGIECIQLRLRVIKSYIKVG